MEKILQTIRGVISGNEKTGEQVKAEDDLLELTEEIKEQLTEVKTTDLPKESAPSSNDVLAQIDAVLGTNNDKQSEQPKAEEAPKSDTISFQPKSELLEKKEEEPAKITNPAIDQVQLKTDVKESLRQINEQILSDSEVNSPKVGDNLKEANKIDSTNETLQDKTITQDTKRKSLISEESANASTEILKSFIKSVSKPTSDGFAFRSGSTVEDLVVEIIKPYLSEWLDSNLPNIVKHLVEKEIQKLIPKDDD